MCHAYVFIIVAIVVAMDAAVTKNQAWMTFI